ncbi:MAG: B12-binding domain-containing radical SAM protein [Deltaproteobacteria bacterium]|nr:B12-binding domain-containing radical SAM protein [Deltaproteobacteria bacterium]
MKIALLKPNDDGVIDDKIDIPFSLLVLGTSLERAGHDVSIFELETNEVDDFAHHDIFGISSVTSTYNATMKLARDLRRKFTESRVFLGGKHFWATSRGVIDGETSKPPAQDIDIPGVTVFTGEADDAILSAIDAPYQPVWHSDKVESLDRIYPLSFHLVDLKNSHRRKFNGKTCVSMGLSRGCPYNCNFCHNKYRGNLRCIKPETFQKEVDNVSGKGLGALYLFDDNFLAFPRLDEYLDVCRESDFSILCLGRADALAKDGVARKLKASNIDAIHIGVESGSEMMLKRMNKKLSGSEITRGLNKAVDAGLYVQISLIIGFPGETWNTLEETVSLLKDIPFHSVSLFPFIPFPGCAVWKNPDKFGITYIDKDFDKYRLLDKYGKPSFVYETTDLNHNTLLSMWEYMSGVFSKRIKHRSRKAGKWELYNEKS